MKKKMGRPYKNETAKSTRFEVRLNEDELKNLEYSSRILGKTSSDIVQLGILTMFGIAKRHEK